MNELHYHDYLNLDILLNAQNLQSAEEGLIAHDEMLFVITHQTYELWFKQLHFELDSIMDIMAKPINDNSPQLQIVVHRLNRFVTILKVLVQEIDILETMTPMDFLDFRDQLRPASGFQSWQFKLLEAKLGLRFDDRHGGDYYLSQLKKQHIDVIKAAENKGSLLHLVGQWLVRMPFINDGYLSGENVWLAEFWNQYRRSYKASLAIAEKHNESAFEAVFFNESRDEGKLSGKACQAALFIMLYRGYPLLQLPFQLLNVLLEIDEQLSSWRNRHMNMVARMIGTRIGTGGTGGAQYLKGATDKHYIFNEIANLTSFLMERRSIPKLPKEIEWRLGFVNS